MEIVWDMGPHGLYVWPAYGVFALVFGGLVLWAAVSAARARAELARRERKREDGR